MAVVVLLVTGCRGREYVRDMNKRLVFLEQVSKKPPNATYIVDPPDSIQIEFQNEPDLTFTAQLRQDGVVTLPYIGEEKFGGMTTEEIQEKLETLYADYYQDPRFVVRVVAYRSKHIYVYGEVGGQGQRPYTGYQQLSDVIGSVGGVTRRAATSRVRVIRGDPEDPEVYRANLNRLIYEGDTTQDVSIAENDVIYVPPTILAWIGYRIEEVLFPFRSILGAAFTYQTAAEIGNNDDDND
jgi:polysaccharide export outer membrane protein